MKLFAYFNTFILLWCSYDNGAGLDLTGTDMCVKNDLMLVECSQKKKRKRQSNENVCRVLRFFCETVCSLVLFTKMCKALQSIFGALWAWNLRRWEMEPSAWLERAVISELWTYNKHFLCYFSMYQQVID